MTLIGKNFVDSMILLCKDICSPSERPVASQSTL